MNNSVKSYVFIAIGAIVAIYANAQKEQNTALLIGGIVCLMFGIYTLSRTIPSRKKEETSFIKEEKEAANTKLENKKED
ncbi:hypothetical protein [Lacinutrix salivirga]